MADFIDFSFGLFLPWKDDAQYTQIFNIWLINNYESY